jgi:hypothetical protein
MSTAQQLAFLGMEAAVAHADRFEDDWSERAFCAFARYAALHREFLTEDVRVYAIDAGLSPPPDPRAWGAIARRAVRERIVKKAGYRLSEVPPAHASPMTLWRSKKWKPA